MILRNAARLNSLTGLAITKLDILGGLEEVKICTRYEVGGRTIDEFPASLDTLAACRPVYETLPGWREDISGARNYDDLPTNARRYIERIAALVGVRLQIVSVGPGRDQTIVLKNPFV